MESSSYFTLEEMACKCKRKCTYKLPNLRVSPTLMQGLNRVREAFGKPITVTSGARCVEHNADVKGSPKSMHLLACAADIRPASGKKEDLERLYELCAEEQVFTGLGDGRKRGFVHVDVRGLKKGETRKVWLY